MIPAHHPTVRAAAAVRAAEALAVSPWSEGVESLWDDLTPESQDKAVDHHVALLVDLTRPDSRDAWVRWGIAWESAQTLRAVASPANDHRQDTLLWRWHSLRDNPSALATAVRSALETP